MCTEKCILVKKMFSNGLNIGLPLRAWIEQTVHGVETYRLSKEKVSGAAASKKRSYWQSSRTWKDSSLLISFKKVQLKTVLPIANPLGKIHLTLWMNLIRNFIAMLTQEITQYSLKLRKKEKLDKLHYLILLSCSFTFLFSITISFDSSVFSFLCITFYSFSLYHFLFQLILSSHAFIFFFLKKFSQERLL